MKWVCFLLPRKKVLVCNKMLHSDRKTTNQCIWSVFDIPLAYFSCFQLCWAKALTRYLIRSMWDGPSCERKATRPTCCKWCCFLFIFFWNELKSLQPLPALGPHGQICPKPKRHLLHLKDLQMERNGKILLEKITNFNWGVRGGNNLH